MPHQKITQALVDGLPYQDSGTLWVHDTELAGVNLSIGQRTKTYYAAGEHGNRFIRVKIGRADVTKANVARGCARPKSSRCTGTRLTSTRARSGSAWVARLSPVMRQLHAAGEKLFVDHAGATVEGACPETGEVRQAQPFVAAPAPRQTAPPACSYPQGSSGTFAERASSTRSARREKPLHTTVVHGGGSEARSRWPAGRAIALTQNSRSRGEGGAVRLQDSSASFRPWKC
ncbi:hypothetical protein C8N38_105114 [Rhodovulum kholense]|uniref:Integrase-like protein n=1 Tax=Rhodovulum kholense TaxID=453584 RepID=A0A8E3AQU2_9RHOB|nr:hypothetical protein C8N38_105114 [Rhodovulum kholense]